MTIADHQAGYISGRWRTWDGLERRRMRDRAEMRALRQLRDLHRDEYDKLYGDALQNELTE